MLKCCLALQFEQLLFVHCCERCVLTLSTLPTMSKARGATQRQSVPHLPADNSCYAANSTTVVVSRLITLGLLFSAFACA